MLIINKLTTGWNASRILYAGIGLYFVWQAIADNRLPLLLIGGYFASMGIFGFGCAAGNCALPNKKRNTINN